MSNNLFNYVYRVTSNAPTVTADMGKLKATVDTVGSASVQMDKQFGGALKSIQRDIKMIKMDALLNQFQRVTDGIKGMNGPGLDFNANMKELEAMTGVAGAKLDEIGNYARKAGVDFGTGASGGVESYKLLLGQLTPEIAKVPKALASMGNSVGITSKLMAGDTTAATEVLTTAMNQYGVSLDNPIAASKVMASMMNVMAAAAGEGSAELPAIKAALEQSGMAAKAAGVSFEETNAAIQVLDKAGKKGSEGGVALRNVMSTLGQGRFLPKNVQEELVNAGVNVRKLTDTSIPLTDRLKALNPIMNDSALISALFGKENSNAALALMQGIPEVERLTIAVKGTNTAQEQANKIMESQIEKNARLQAGVDDFKISLFNATNGAMGYANVLGQVAFDVANLMPLMSGASAVVTTLTNATKRQELVTKLVGGATKVWTVIQGAFNAVMAMNPLVWVVLAVAALTAAIVIVAKKTEGWGAMWKHTVNGAKLLFQAYVEGVKLYFGTMVNGMMIGINLIMKKWYEFKNAVGIGDKSGNNAAIAKINADTEARKKAIVDGAKKVADLTKASAAEFKAGFNSVKWKSDDKKEGIAEPGMPGVPGSKPGTYTGAGGGSPNKTNTAIATGGTKHNYITITIGEVVGLKANNVAGGKDVAQQVGQLTQDELIRILAMASTAAE